MAMASEGGTAAKSRLAQMQMKFQKKQLMEREQKRQALTTDDVSIEASTSTNGKVRQIFENHRRGVGIDRSSPLKPIATTKAQPTPTANNNNNTNTNTNTKRSNSTNSRYYTSHNANNILATTTIRANRRYGGGKDTRSFDEVDNINNEINFAKLHITPNQINVKTKSDRNNNNYKQNGQSRIADMPDSNVGAIKRNSFQANAVKLNPVVMKRTPNVIAATTKSTPAAASTATAAAIANRNRRSSIGSYGTASGASNRSTTQSPSTRMMASSLKTTNRNYTNDGKKPVIRTANIVPRSATFNMAAKPPPRITAPPEGMSTCRYCQRHFNDERLAKHEDVCRRMISVKRKVFDATTHRIRGTEAEQYLKKSTLRGPVTPATRYSSAAAVINLKMEPNQAVKKNNWRKKHEEFILAIREAKKVQAHLARGGKLSDLPPPPPSDTSDYIQCPHCGRRFNQEAAERHIPKCANMRHNKPKPPQKR